MKTIVTGAAGLLGSEIVSLSNSVIGLTSKDCNLVESASALQQFTQADTVIHCAAKVGGVKANTDYVADFFDENVKMNMNVIKVCKESGLKLVSILSTCIYPDEKFVNYPLTENQLHLGPPHDSNFGYAYAKRMLDVQTRAYRKQYNCNFITVIPNSLYGKNDNFDLNSGHVIPALIRKFYEAKFHGYDYVEIWGSGKPLREFTFAKDAAQIILWLAENYNEEQSINIGNPEQISIKELAQIISDEIGFEGNIVFDSSKPDGQYQKPSSNQKLRDLGWNGEYTSLREGIKLTVESFVSNYPNIRGVTIQK